MEYMSSSKKGTSIIWELMSGLRDDRPHRFGDQIRLNSFFPPYPSVAFHRFCEMVLSRRRIPLSTYFAVTSRCPFSCGHCSYGQRPIQEMDLAEARDVVSQIKALGTCTLGFTGGEPLLRPDLEDLISAAGPEMATVVFTTGWGLDEDRARRLARAEVTCVTVGVEAPQAERHDAIRGLDGSFLHARRAVQACRQAGVYPAISTMGTRQRLESGELEDLYALGEQWGALEMRIIAPVATGSMAGETSAMLSEAELQHIRDFHIRMNRRGEGPTVVAFPYIESGQLFGCGAGYHHLFIDAEGNVCPCDLTPLSFGSLRKETLASIWQRMEAHFALPRQRCLMNRCAQSVPSDAALPLAPEISEQIVPQRNPSEPLPGMYQQVFDKVAEAVLEAKA